MSEGEPTVNKFLLIPSKKAAIALSIALLVPAAGFAATPEGNSQFNLSGIQIAQGLPPLQGYVVTAPAGTYMQATLQSTISSEFARPGDRVVATLGTPLAAGGSIVLPAGSQVEGQVVAVEDAGRLGKNGSLDIRFTSAMTPTGQRVPISARIQTEDGTGVLKGGSTKGRVGKAALRTGVGAGLGAALGTAMGPLSGGKVGRGAIYGTAIGGGLGALYAGAKKGEDAVLNAGEPINLVLDAPVTVSPQDNFSQQQQPYNNPYNQPYNSQPYGQPASPSGNPYGQPANPYNGGGYYGG